MSGCSLEGSGVPGAPVPWGIGLSRRFERLKSESELWLEAERLGIEGTWEGWALSLTCLCSTLCLWGFGAVSPLADLTASLLPFSFGYSWEGKAAGRQSG